MPVYNTNTPKATDLISATQSPINNNFYELDRQFGIDHQPFKNSGVNGDGLHKKVTFVEPIADPVPVGTQSVIYPKTVDGKVQPFFVNATRAVQLAGDLYTYVPNATATGAVLTVTNPLGYYYQAGGLVFFFGSFSVSSNMASSGPLNITLPSTAINGGAGQVQGSLIAFNSAAIASSATTMISFASTFPNIGSPTNVVFSGFYQ